MGNNAAKSIKKNYLYNVMYQILAFIVPLVTTPYVSRVLGATGIGDYNYTVGIVTYFGLIAATGTSSFGNREIAKHQDDSYECSKLFWEIWLFRLTCTIVALIAYVLFISFFLKQYRYLFLIQLFTVGSWIADVSWFCQGMENFKVTALRNVFIKIFGTAMVFLLVKTKNDLWIYTMIYSVTFLLGNISMWGFVAKLVHWIPIKELKPFKHARGILELFIPVIAIQIYTVLDKTMLGTLGNTTEVGYYAQADKIVTLALTIISSFIAVLLPRISALYATGEKIQLERFINKALDYIFLLSLPMMAGCLILIDEFVPAFFGNGYEPVVQVIQALSILYIVLSLGRLFGTLLIAEDKQNRYTLAVTIASIINFGFNCAFLKFTNLGALGVSFASVLAECVATVIQFCYIRDIISMDLLLKSVKKYICPTIIMTIVLVILRLALKSNIFIMCIQVMVGIGVYFIILVINKDQIIYSVIQQFMKRLKKCN